MAFFRCIIPGILSTDATSPDEMLRSTTFLFGLKTQYSALNNPNGGVLSDLLVRRGHEPGAICARSGNYFPGEHLTTDGQGRLVGKQFRTEGPAVIPELPFPVFYTSPGEPVI